MLYRKILLFCIFLIAPLYSQLEIEDLKENFTTDKIFLTEEDFVDETKTSLLQKIKAHFTFRTTSNDEDVDSIYMPKDKFQPLYLYNRALVSYNEKLSLGYVFLHKPQEIEVDNNTLKYFFRKWWIKNESLFFINKIILGHYKVNFGYGMVFSEDLYLSKYFRNITPKPTRITQDNTSSDNANFCGVAIEDNICDFNYMLFFSQKDLIIKDTDYFISNNDLLDIRNDYINYDENLLDYDERVPFSMIGKLPTSLNKETLFGVSVLFTKERIKVGFCSHYALYEKAFDPDKTNVAGYFLENKYSDRWQYVFRGDRLFGSSFYYEMFLGKSRLFVEVAKSLNWFSKISESYNEGYGVNIGFLFPIKNHKFSILYTYLQPTFFSPFGNPFKIYKYPNTQCGIDLVNFFSFDNLSIEVLVGLCEILKGIWSSHLNSEAPRYPFLFQQLTTKLRYKMEKITLEIRNYTSIEEKFINTYKYDLSENSNYIQTKFFTVGNLYKVQYEIFKGIFVETRCYQIWKKLLFYEKDFYSESLFLLFSYLFNNFKVGLNYNIFSINRHMDFIMLEQVWKNVYSFKLYNSDLSFKNSFVIFYDAKKFSLWLLIDQLGFTERETKYNIRLQLDIEI